MYGSLVSSENSGSTWVIAHSISPAPTKQPHNIRLSTIWVEATGMLTAVRTISAINTQ